MAKVLFILKRKDNYNEKTDSHIGLSTGLYNSASFVSSMLNDVGIESKLSVVIDNNCIDREVSRYKPTHVIIEALWVVPEKFNVLQRLHPNVTWIIRIHSEMPFMSGEGPAMDWIAEYSTFKNMIISPNAPRMLSEIRHYLKIKNHWDDRTTNERVPYLPNFYPQEYKSKKLNQNKPWIDIGCFGAVRPLKNHLLQAHAAIMFAEKNGKTLRYHVNTGRVEMQGGPALKNLKDLFLHMYDRGHRLVNHQWTPREEFLHLCGQMDIGMQCNFSETFNIVGADLISQGVPLIGTKEIPWQVIGKRDPTDSEDIVNGLMWAYHCPDWNVKLNQTSLKAYTNKTKKIWSRYFGE